MRSFYYSSEVFLLEAELRTSCWLQTARSETFPQPTGTTSKQRSGSQPKTRRESVDPLNRQPPSGLKNTHLNTQRSEVTFQQHAGQPAALRTLT